MSLFQQCLESLKQLSDDARSLLGEASNLKTEAIHLSPLDPNALNLQDDLYRLSRKIIRLHNFANSQMEVINTLKKNFPLSVEHQKAIEESWALMVASVEATQAAVHHAHKIIKEQNAWGGIASFFQDLLDTLEGLIHFIAKPLFGVATWVLEGTKELKLLPWKLT
jgi:hypothetical protein